MQIRALLPAALACLAAGCMHAVPASAPRVLLLGEVHDSAAGHAKRAALLRDEVAAGWRPAIAMEQFDTDQQAALDAAMRDCKDADCVVARVVPAKTGWTWDYYKPVITLALMSRFASRGNGDHANRLLALMRRGFGGHAVTRAADERS